MLIFNQKKNVNYFSIPYEAKKHTPYNTVIWFDYEAIQKL